MTTAKITPITLDTYRDAVAEVEQVAARLLAANMISAEAANRVGYLRHNVEQSVAATIDQEPGPFVALGCYRSEADRHESITHRILDARRTLAESYAQRTLDLTMTAAEQQRAEIGQGAIDELARTNLSAIWTVNL